MSKRPKDSKNLEAAAPGMPANSAPQGQAYRVLETVRDADGRMRMQGNVWHPTLDMARRLARAVATNDKAHRVVVADSSGNVLEEVPPADASASGALWAGGWRHLSLPPLPPSAAKRYPPTVADLDIRFDGT